MENVLNFLHRSILLLRKMEINHVGKIVRDTFTIEMTCAFTQTELTVDYGFFFRNEFVLLKFPHIDFKIIINSYKNSNYKDTQEKRCCCFWKTV